MAQNENENNNFEKKLRTERKDLVSSGDCTLDTVTGIGYFADVVESGNQNGFSYTSRNMFFASAENEAERLRVSDNINRFSKSLSVSDETRPITIVPNFLNRVGKTVFIGDELPNFINDTSLINYKSIPSLQSAYPQDKNIIYPLILDREADIVLTSSENLLLQVLSRDCITATIVIKKPGLYLSGLIHAGWKQVDGLIGNRLVKDLVDRGYIDRTDIKIAIAPCLRKEHAIMDHLGGISNESSWLNFIERKDDGYHLDFVSLFKKQLLEVGVPEENILDCDIDSYSAQSQGVGHSARYQREHGLKASRMMTAIKT